MKISRACLDGKCHLCRDTSCMHDCHFTGRLLSPRRLFFAVRLWAMFALRGDFRYPLWQYVRYYRRQAAAERDDTTFFCKAK